MKQIFGFLLYLCGIYMIYSYVLKYLYFSKLIFLPIVWWRNWRTFLITCLTWGKPHAVILFFVVSKTFLTWIIALIEVWSIHPYKVLTVWFSFLNKYSLSKNLIIWTKSKLTVYVFKLHISRPHCDEITDQMLIRKTKRCNYIAYSSLYLDWMKLKLILNSYVTSMFDPCI